MSYSLPVAFVCFVAGAAFFLTGTAGLGSGFVAVGAVFVALAYADKEDPDPKD